MQTTGILKLLLLTILLVTYGCAQRDSDAGESAVPLDPEVLTGQTTITATNSAEWDLNLSTGLGTTLQIGEAQQFKSVAAIRFDLAGALPDSYSVDTARIRFRVDQVYPGRGNAPDLRMLIRSITDPWSEDSLLEDSLPHRADYPVIDTLLLPTGILTEDSALPPAIYWNIPDSIFERWADTSQTSYGLLLEAENPNVIVGLQSAEGVEDYLIQLELIGTQFPADSNFAASAWSDTLRAADDGYLATDLSDSLSGRLRISQGVHRRGLLYFPLDSITANPLRTVARAFIHLYADVNAPNSLTYTGSNFLYKDASVVDTSWFANTDSTVQNFIAVTSTSFGADNRELTFEVTGSLAGMVGQPETNGGFSIQASLESGVLSRQFFYGHNSEVDTLKPTLEIWWVAP